MVCPRCGTQNSQDQASCAVCGSRLSATVMSFPSESAPRSEPTAALRQTLLGHQGPPVGAPPGGAPSSTGAAPPGARRGNLTGTLLGIPAPNREPAPTDPGPTTAGAPTAAPGPLPGSPGSHTMMGIAHPGIAPLEPGRHHNAPGQAPPPPIEPAPPSYRRPGKFRVPLVAALVLTLAGALLSAALVALVLYLAPVTLEAKAVLTPDGKQLIELSCESCDDGTSVTYQGKKASFRNRRAALPVEKPLEVGENQLKIQVTGPGSSRQREVSLGVPVEYRVHTHLDGLKEAAPRVSVSLQALPGSRVMLNGAPAEVSAEGTASCDVDLTSELTGSHLGVERVERRIDYQIELPGSATRSGTTVIQLDVVPLSVVAPGPRITLDGQQFTLAGSTTRGASVGVEGHRIEVDANGSFAQPMSVSAVGEKTIVVRADKEGMAPRLFPITVRRVESLREEARARAQEDESSYDRIVEQLKQDHPIDVGVMATVVELRSSQRSSRLLAEIRDGCPEPPCLARVIHGAPVELKPEAKIRIFGRATRLVDGPRSGSRIPELDTTFVIPVGGR